MTGPSRLSLLELLCECYDEADEPVGTGPLAEATGSARAAVRRRLVGMAELDLVARAGEDRFRPTVTARELLALEVDPESVLIVDAGERD